MPQRTELIAIGPTHPELIHILQRFGAAPHTDQLPTGQVVLAILFRLDSPADRDTLKTLLGVQDHIPGSTLLRAHHIDWPHLKEFAKDHDRIKDFLALHLLLQHDFTIFFREEDYHDAGPI